MSDPFTMSASPPQGSGSPLEPPVPEGQVLDRNTPEVSPRRKALVTAWTDMVKSAKTHWKKVFDQMVKDQKFAYGAQWPEERKALAFNDDFDDRYIANITLRHIQQRVAALYAKNPKAVVRRRPRLLSTVWDGTMESFQQAQAVLQQAQAAQQQMMQLGVQALAGSVASMMGVPMPGGAGPPGEAPMSPGGPPGGPPAMGGPPGLGHPGVPEPPPGTPPMTPTGGPLMPPTGPDMGSLEEAKAIVDDAQQVKKQITMLNRIARTLELLYGYEVSEQQQPFKSMMKMTVRRASTSGVGWTRVGFQRVMGPSPDKDSRIADMQMRLNLIEGRVSADIADNQSQLDTAEAEQLRLAIEAATKETEVILREGLQFTWPRSTSIIPDARCTQLRDFLGCDWVAEEFLLSTNEVKETYKVDVCKNYTSYNRSDIGSDYERARASWLGTSDIMTNREDAVNISTGDGDCAIVWEIYNKRDGLVYVVCDGYPDFLREPAAPDVYTDRFWPWFATMFNECDGKVFPPSDVQLVRPMQLELNRSRQGLREHRFANRPATAHAEGVLSEEDKEALRSHPVNALISIAGLMPNQKIDDVLQPIKGVPVDPNLYEVNPVFQDLLRAVGDQEANLGGTAGATATETNIAQASRASAIGSATDDIDETLNGIARASGQILLLNMTPETVKQIVGPGAIWPTLSKSEVSKEIYLEIEAGSSGRPNQAQEIQNFERLAPIIMQVPGIKPSWMAKEAIKRLDDNMDMEEAMSEGIPSITAMNGVSPGSSPGGPGAEDPAAQGPKGASNSPAPPPPSPSAPSPGGKNVNGPPPLMN